MEGTATPATPLWPLALYVAGTLILVGGMMGLSYILGQRHRNPQTDEPFESGVKPVGSARVRFDIKFYLVAMFFVVFDLEAAFLFAWAVAARETGWPGYVEALVFILILFAGLVYLWRLGALDWGTLRRRVPRRPGAVVRPLPPPTPPGQRPTEERIGSGSFEA